MQSSILDNGVVCSCTNFKKTLLVHWFHEKSLSIQFYEVFCISILPLDHSMKNTDPKSWNMTSENKDVKIQL